MQDTTTQKGFTLVELAIVMTIIGLLIGGILKGQELMANARITATIAQVRAYEAAVTTFRDKYDAVPGDMANAAVRLPGCTGAGINCNPAAAVPAANVAPGDGIVGRTDYTTNAAAWATQTNATSDQTPPANQAASISYETTLFWSHLLLSDLISGVTNVSVATPAVPAAWGDSHPGAKAGGGFVVGYGGGARTPGSAIAVGGPTGMIMVLVTNPTTGGVVAMGQTNGVQPLTPTRAAQMDRKMDDGRPTAGFVQAYGVNGANVGDDGCTSTAAPFSAVSPGFLESSTNLNCGLVFRIQG